MPHAHDCHQHARNHHALDSRSDSRGVYRIANWSHITNAHPVPGDGIVRGLREVGLVDTSIRRKPRSKDGDDAVWLDMPRGLLLLAEMSSQGSLAVGQYTDKCVEMVRSGISDVFSRCRVLEYWFSVMYRSRALCRPRRIPISSLASWLRAA